MVDKNLARYLIGFDPVYGEAERDFDLNKAAIRSMCKGMSKRELSTVLNRYVHDPKQFEAEIVALLELIDEA